MTDSQQTGRQAYIQADRKEDRLEDRQPPTLHLQTVIKNFLNILIHFPIVHPVNGSLTIVRLVRIKHSEVICLQAEVKEVSDTREVLIYADSVANY